MKALLSTLAILFLSMVPAVSAGDDAPPAPGPMSEESIRKNAMLRKIDGAIDMPEQTMEERAARINDLIRKLGYSEKQLKVTVEPGIEKSKIGFIHLKDAQLIDVFKYTFDARRITMKITKGNIEIVTMKETADKGK